MIFFVTLPFTSAGKRGRYSFPNGPPGTARHGHGHGQARHGEARHYAARRPAVPCLIVPPCRSGSPGTALSSVNRAVPCQQARWHASARAGPGTNTFLTQVHQHKSSSSPGSSRNLSDSSWYADKAASTVSSEGGRGGIATGLKRLHKCT